MLKRFTIALSAVACGGALLAAPASAQTSDDEMVKSYRAELAPLNAPGSGQASIDVVDGQASVSVQASNLSPAVAPHAQHIHGELGAANTCPDPDTADSDGDGVVTTAEGLPFYGGIQVSLTTEGDTSADSALAVSRFPVTEQGAYSYDRTVPVSSDVADAFGNLHIVIHGIDLNKSGEYDGERRSSLTDELPLEATVPAACGAIKLTDIDLPAPYDGASGIEGTVIRLYVSMLDRTPDSSGFEYWVNQLEGDASVRTIAWSFAESEEFQERYGDMLEAPTGEWVDFVYSAVLGRIADSSGRQYWINQIEAGNVSRTEMLILFSESDEFMRLTGTS